MPKIKKPNSAPPLRVHKATGQAYVILDGQRRYLGRHDDPKTQARYRRLVAEWSARGAVDTSEGLSVAELLALYWTHAESYYRRADGTPTWELYNVKQAVKPVRELYADTPANEFTPVRLKACRQALIDRGLARTNINKAVSRIKRVFRWAVAECLIEPSVFQGLQALDGLRRGRTTAKDHPPVMPVADAIVDQTVKHCTPTVTAMIRLLQWSGMRIGELCVMRTADVDTTGRTWTYRPIEHKTAYIGRQRIVYLGPKAKAILKPWLRTELEAFVFTPEQSERERRDAMHVARKTPMSCGNKPGSNVKRRPRRTPSDRWTAASFGKALDYACDRAFPPPEPLAKREGETHKQWQARLTDEQKAELREWRKAHRWTAHQLRHSYATRIRKEHGLEAAQVLLGHARADVTQVDAEVNAAKAIEVAGKVG